MKTVFTFDPQTSRYIGAHDCQPCQVTEDYLYPQYFLETAPAQYGPDIIIIAKNGEWVVDMEASRKDLNARIDAEHEKSILALTGNPTEVERNTWAGKVGIAEAIQAGAELTPSQSAFLDSLGVTKAKRKDYADSVLAKSAKYWQLLGLADRIRGESKARINAAKTADELLMASQENLRVSMEVMAQLKAAP